MLVGRGRSASSADIRDQTFGRKLPAFALGLAGLLGIAPRVSNGAGRELPGRLERIPRLAARRIGLFGLKRIDHSQQCDGEDNASHLMILLD
ncbi:hypothetical protein [Bradyrhizobium sp. DOA9]|uniref:hypothetical protein n=1 Tax=Bradyrhizobium sp. DOA9 TaxID=1126627 RepID=UPI000AB6386F|nr:hypothetical protein [Bradyrhizobium sp. DOA9]